MNLSVAPCSSVPCISVYCNSVQGSECGVTSATTVNVTITSCCACSLALVESATSPGGALQRRFRMFAHREREGETGSGVPGGKGTRFTPFHAPQKAGGPSAEGSDKPLMPGRGRERERTLAILAQVNLPLPLGGHSRAALWVCWSKWRGACFNPPRKAFRLSGPHAFLCLPPNLTAAPPLGGWPASRGARHTSSLRTWGGGGEL